MTRVRVKHVNRVTKRLADGTVRVHFYHRLAHVKLTGEPGTPEFIESYAEAQRKLRDGFVQRRGAILRTVIAAFQGSVQFGALRHSTQVEYRRLLKAADIEFGDLPISAFPDPRTRGDLLAWRDKIAAGGKLREAENRLTVLARVFAWGVDRGMSSANPLVNWGRTYDADRADKIWSPAHVEAFAAIARPEMNLALYVALYSGQRQGDLLKLTWTNYRDGVLYLKQSKGSRHVVVPCVAELSAMLNTLRDSGRTSTHILTTPAGRPWRKRHFSALFKDTCERAGVPDDLHFHDLRGTAVTMLADAECTEAEIVSITGHTLKSAHDILEKYTSRTAAQSHSAMRKLGNYLATVAAKTANRAANQTSEPNEGVA